MSIHLLGLAGERSADGTESLPDTIIATNAAEATFFLNQIADRADMTTVWTVWAQSERKDKLSLMSASKPNGPAKADRFLKEFIQRLDLGEFDGKLHEVLKDLTHEELMKVAEYLATRHH